MKTIVILFLFISFSTFSMNPPADIPTILKSGNGQSIKTAYEVNSVMEEYELLDYLKLKMVMQKLIIVNDCFYDAITTNSRVIYFKVVTKKLPNKNKPQII